jgi:hypothetical protein
VHSREGWSEHLKDRHPQEAAETAQIEEQRGRTFPAQPVGVSTDPRRAHLQQPVSKTGQAVQFIIDQPSSYCLRSAFLENYHLN